MIDALRSLSRTLTDRRAMRGPRLYPVTSIKNIITTQICICLTSFDSCSLGSRPENGGLTHTELYEVRNAPNPRQVLRWQCYVLRPLVAQFMENIAQDAD